jgi:hypothetical protein
MKVIKPSEPIKDHDSFISVFLAGSIEMGQVENWQARVEQELSDYSDAFLTVLNPRRDDFQENAVQSINNPYFKGQVDWESEGLCEATFILMYFHPDTKAPVTLLELGLHAEDGPLLVVCPEGYWRKGNVEMVCHDRDIPLFLSLEEGIAELRRLLDYEKDFMINNE